MTYDEIVEMAEEAGLPVAYDHFSEGESPDPPYLIFRFPEDNNFSADGTTYAEVTALDFELYTDYKDPELERVIETILTSHGIFYDRSETWIPDEKMYEVLYEMEVLYADSESE